jgi:hypothetical protein
MSESGGRDLFVRSGVEMTRVNFVSIVKRWCLAVALCVAGTIPTQAQSADSRDEASIKGQLTAYAEASQRGDGHARYRKEVT